MAFLYDVSHYFFPNSSSNINETITLSTSDNTENHSNEIVSVDEAVIGTLFKHDREESFLGLGTGSPSRKSSTTSATESNSPSESSSDAGERYHMPDIPSTVNWLIFSEDDDLRHCAAKESLLMQEDLFISSTSEKLPYLERIFARDVGGDEKNHLKRLAERQFTPKFGRDTFSSDNEMLQALRVASTALQRLNGSVIKTKFSARRPKRFWNKN
eukprot:TRINITY_DN67054_c0_g1_i4.p1 TRINITY_DN67054_c0_g1~~TRINITY_DN67054_c0_g1_i4.p1  ORF type:complete len:214 (+),score=12.20 TRINITY_DN67054_c0_g1_i4:108-749(+)